MKVDSFRLARDLAVRGYGIARIARVLAAPMVAEGRLVPVLERHWTRTSLFAIHAGPSPAEPKVRAFIDVARTIVGQAFPTAG